MKYLLILLFLTTACASKNDASTATGVVRTSPTGIWIVDSLNLDLQFISVGNQGPIELKAGVSVCRYLATFTADNKIVIQSEQIVSGSGAECALLRNAMSYWVLNDKLIVSSQTESRMFSYASPAPF